MDALKLFSIFRDSSDKSLSYIDFKFIFGDILGWEKGPSFRSMRS